MLSGLNPRNKVGKRSTRLGTQYDALLQAALGQIDSGVPQARKDISQQYQGMATSANQDLISRGLSGTTIMPTIQAGIKREELGSQARLDEQLRKERMDALMQTMLPKLGFRTPKCRCRQSRAQAICGWAFSATLWVTR